MSISPWLRRRVFKPFWAYKDDSLLFDYLEQAERHQRMSADDLDRLQLSRLRVLLDHAEKHVPYYTRAFSRLGFRTADLGSWGDFAQLPLLTKSDVQNHGDTLKATALPDPRDRFIENMTGGSTGQPLKFWVNKRRLESREASTIRHNRWAGWRLGEPMAVLWGAQRDLPRAGALKARVRHALVDGSFFLNTMGVTRESLEEFARTLRRRRPRVWLAYAGSAALFARYCKEHSVNDISAEGIITSSEVLTPENRSLIEQTFGARVFDRYGCREVSVVASECGEAPGHAMHVNADWLRVEVVGADEGERGKIVITDLANFATPFIRYQIEDVSRFVDESCSCGRTLPLLAPLEGRTTDFIVTGDGRAISGIALCTYLLTSLDDVEKGQLLQDRAGEVVLRFVPAASFDGASEQKMQSLARKFLGSDTKIELERVDEIPLSASGKYPFTISSVDTFEIL